MQPEGTVQVWPKNEQIRKIIRHPTAGAFGVEGPSVWPDDQYTARRIADGDVLTEAPQEAPKQEPQSYEPPSPEQSTEE
jgi:hypothetical protein